MSRKKNNEVRLTGLPPGFMDNLPEEDRIALLDAVGKPVQFNGYGHWGRAELEFKDRNGVWHFIYLDPKLNLYTDTN